MTETDSVGTFIREYCSQVDQSLNERWAKVPLDLSKTEMFEVLGALLARQVSLTTQLAMSPQSWNGHVAPLYLRAMIDCHINLAWVLKEPLERSRKFIRFGLGQEKLQIEHYKAKVSENPDLQEGIDAREAWLNAQRFEFLTDVNVGNWAGASAREMAQEAGLIDLYNYAYMPFSSVVHSMWHHVGRYNLDFCESVIHNHHRMPTNRHLKSDLDYLYRSAKYAHKSFVAFDEHFKLDCKSGPIDIFNSAASKVKEKASEEPPAN